jgi:probable F420-dependent oxidoreductase
MRFHQAVAFLPTHQQVALAQAADDQGYDGMYLSDHMFSPRHRQSRYTYSKAEDGSPSWEADTDWPDVWCVISAMAALTKTVRFTTGVYVAPARDIITVAKQVGTAAVLSSNRVTLGVGVGWCKEEFDATGQDFATRGKRLDDMIPALRTLWGGGWVQYHGPHYDLPELRMDPSPTEPIPIICGGHSAPALRRASELCDGWVAAGAYTPDEARQYLGMLHEARHRAGREDEPFAIYLSLWANPDIDLYRRFEEDYGVTDMLSGAAMAAEVNASDSPAAQLQTRIDASARFAEEVVEKMR